MVDKGEEEEHFDCLLVGAGISGLDAAYHIQKKASWATFAILERRGNLGGTWDFFKYPGLRCDSKMYTFGFYWKPWESVEPIASKEEIQTYLREAAEEHGLLEKIKFKGDKVSFAEPVDPAKFLPKDSKALYFAVRARLPSKR